MMKQTIMTWLALVLSSLLWAQEYQVADADELRAALRIAVDGDSVRLSAGDYVGRFEIQSGIRIEGTPQTILDAQGEGNVLTVLADNVVIRNLTLRNWGRNLTDTNSGIKAVQVANLTIHNNRLNGPGFGIYLEQVIGAEVRANEITGNPEMRSADRGNGIHLISSQQVLVSDNRVRQTRDGLYIISSQHNELRNNRMTDLRFGVHYMYSHSNTVTGNYAANVDVGYALMSSQKLIIENNTAESCRDYGLLMNFINQSVFSGNEMNRVQADSDRAIAGDAGKALFIYNATGNVLHHNTFANSDLGIHLTAGSEGNQIYANNFINNRTQVKYVSSREQEWSLEGQGNYWSDYIGWDLDQDGLGDTAFEPNDGIDKLLWRYPEARVLMDSPAVRLLRWVQHNFPVLKSPGVKDSHPSLNPIGVSQ